MSARRPAGNGLVCRALLVILTVLAAACGAPETGSPPGGTPSPEPTAADEGDQEISGTVRLYSSVTQETVDAVQAVFAEAHDDVDLEVFRAPTGELNARLAAEQREGGVQADVLWLTDPLSIQAYDAQGMLRAWTPEEADAIPEDFRTDTFWGTRVLNMVIVAQEGLDPAPSSWDDLADESYPQPVAIPDPSFAGSAFGALGYFALEEAYGFDYYRSLADAGAVQVQAPDEVTTGVAQGRFSAGMTLDFSAREAEGSGSPVMLVWPEPGAIAMYSPVAVVDGTPNAEAAEAFANVILSQQGQEAIAASGWQPVRDDVTWTEPGGPTVSPDWTEAFDRQDALLADYRAIFGG
jgi:iron(III) transport system substrate-binding protein